MVQSEYQCDRYYQNATYILFTNTSGWEGIPQTAVVNAVGFPILLLIFIVLRKFAWDFGRAAHAVKSAAANATERWASLFYGDTAPICDALQQQTEEQMEETRRERGAVSWLRTFWRLSDEQVCSRCGSDAMQYLIFERYLIVYSLAIMVLSMCVIFPLNFTADEKVDPSRFSRTTITSVEADNPVLWTHATLAVLYTVMAFVLMKRFSDEATRLSTKAESECELATRTLIIRNVHLYHSPRQPAAIAEDELDDDAAESDVALATRFAVERYFADCFPLARVVDVQFAHDIARLSAVNQKRAEALESLLNAEAELTKTSTETRPIVYPFACSSFWCCCSTCCCRHRTGESAGCGNGNCEPVDAIEYYRVAVARLTDKCSEERERARRRVLPVAFVTFGSQAQASEVFIDFQTLCCSLGTPRVHSAVARHLRVLEWDVRFAPTPDNIYWKNLATPPSIYWLRAISINVAVFLLTFFLTTPSILIQKYNSIQFTGPLVSHPLFVQFVPTVILWLSAVLLPTLVSTSGTLIGHWTKTGEHLSTMTKCFVFLLLMVLILPSVGLPSADALLAYVLSRTNYRLLWQCVLMSSNGAFFVSYMIMSALLGNALELLRLSDLVMYVARMCATRSSAERMTVRKRVCSEFQFGVNYAWLLTTCAILVTYSITVPLITPCGLLYLVVKYYVDKYNLYYAYLPSKINRKIHRTAINFFLVGALLLQFNLVIFLATQFSTYDPPQRALATFSLISLLLSFAAFFFTTSTWLQTSSRSITNLKRSQRVDNYPSRQPAGGVEHSTLSSDSDLSLPEKLAQSDATTSQHSDTTTVDLQEETEEQSEEDFVFVPNLLN